MNIAHIPASVAQSSKDQVKVNFCCDKDVLCIIICELIIN